MNHLIAILFFIMGASELRAETVIQLHTVSYHVNRAADFNEENLGIGFRHYADDVHYITAGTYKNSEYNQSNYAGYGWEWKQGDFKLGLSAGIITGYELGEVLPYVVPVIRYKAVSLIIAPYPEVAALLTIDLGGL